MQEKVIITSIKHSELPEGLKRLHKVPRSLNLKGNADLLSKSPRVGIIGARKFTPYGKEVTTQITASLSRAGVVIVSGLALGVDSIAHKTALDAGGHTIAVLPSGVNSIYPSAHSGLAKQIVQKDGLLISEYQNNFRPYKATFLERNRIIAALSDILIITEAASASGSLNTASYALDMGITVMAVPGPITSPYSRGTNGLIKAGAEPLLDPKEVLQILGIEDFSFRNQYLPENETEKLILAAIQSGKSTTNEIISQSGLKATEIQAHLTNMEIKGVLKVQSGIWTVI